MSIQARSFRVLDLREEVKKLITTFNTNVIAHVVKAKVFRIEKDAENYLCFFVCDHMWLEGIYISKHVSSLEEDL